MELHLAQTRAHIDQLATDAESALQQHQAPALPGTDCPGTGAFVAALNAATSTLFHRIHTQGGQAQSIAEHQRHFLHAAINTDASLAQSLSRKALP